MSAYSKRRIAELAERERELVSGSISVNDFKSFSAQDGIYPQRDGLFMLRVRVPGGHLELESLYGIVAAARSASVRFAHITTRQDIQLHGVPQGSVCHLAKGLDKAGMPLCGGGGNTVRNIVACRHGAVAPSSHFDSALMANELSNFIMSQPNAYDLPRKLKFAVSCCPHDCAGAAWHDLGFLVRESSPEGIGFSVFGGGGLGREPSPSIMLLDFVHPSDVFRCALAMLNLFHEHGDRKDKSSARLRFVLKRMGETAFRDLFMEHYDAAQASAPDGFALPPRHPMPDGAAPLELPVSGGDISLDFLETAGRLAAKFGQTFLRLSQLQSIWLPCVGRHDAHEAGLEFAKALNIPKLKVLSCIGSSICKIGMLDAQNAASRLAEALSALPFEWGRIERFASFICISGCHNSCSGHSISALGLHGFRKNVNGVSCGFYKVSFGGFCSENGVSIGKALDGVALPEQDMPKLMADVASKLLASDSELSAESIAETLAQRVAVSQ